MDSDRSTIDQVFGSAETILIGHSHYDHLLDAPVIARKTGATIFGSKTTCVLSESFGLEGAECRKVLPGKTFRRGPFSLTPLASQHGRLKFLGVPFPGKRETPLKTKFPHITAMPHGEVLVWVIRVEGLTIVHISSAGLPDDPTQWLKAVPEGADLVLATIALRQNTPAYTRSLVAYLKPRIVIPHHPSGAFTVLSDQFTEAENKEFSSFAAEAKGTTVIRLDPFKERVFRTSTVKAMPAGRLPNTIGALNREEAPAPQE